MNKSLTASPVVIFDGKMSRSSLSISSHRVQKASPAVCLLRHDDGQGNTKFVRGIGVLYPDIKHLYFAEEGSLSAEKFWRAMYAASLTSVLYLSDVSVQMAILISDINIPLNDLRFDGMRYCMGYGETLESYRSKVMEAIIPSGDLDAITEGFKFHMAPLDMPTTAILEKDDHAYGLFHYPEVAYQSGPSLA